MWFIPFKNIFIYCKKVSLLQTDRYESLRISIIVLHLFLLNLSLRVIVGIPFGVILG